MSFTFDRCCDTSVGASAWIWHLHDVTFADRGVDGEEARHGLDMRFDRQPTFVGVLSRRMISTCLEPIDPMNPERITQVWSMTATLLPNLKPLKQQPIAHPAHAVPFVGVAPVRAPTKLSHTHRHSRPPTHLTR
jgi:hypothetical protein